ncbi:MAG: hypothetical protein CL947_00525 [Epsilonproteobacteria bacterium]|nr:hypothetical protein [Campylobacterota bacterium]|tara:strand:+ start:4416 stop:5609 length:1194 start_codon:yes stop_codon:yes gene_type:complete
MNKYIFFSISINIFLLSYTINPFTCVGICGNDIVAKSKRGQLMRKSIEELEHSMAISFEQERKLVASKELDLVTKEKGIKEQAELLRKEGLADEQSLQAEEDNLHKALDAYEQEKQELLVMQKKLHDQAQQMKQAIDQKYYRDLQSFDKEVIKKQAMTKNWDIVFAQENPATVYVAQNLDKTDELLQDLKKEEELFEKTYTTQQEVKEFFKSLGIVYLDTLEISPDVVGDINGFYTAYYDANKATLYQNSRNYMPLVKKKHRGPIAVKWVSDKVGFGVFATDDIKAGEFIQEYIGILMPVSTSNGLTKHDTTYAWVYPAAVANYSRGELLVDSKHKGNETRFVNHGNQPNTLKIDVLDEDGIYHQCYVAKQEIKAGEQLLVSYGSEYWTTRNFFDQL